jgi:CDP-diacylglycerol--serine O-phosphatidyltransferase
VRDHLTLANLVTTCGLGAGFGALLVSQHAVGLAAGLVAGSAVLDGLDGVLARRSGGDLAFGGQLDSLTDVVCFGVVPAATLWWVLVHELPVVGALACGAFLAAGAWRLARFHLVQRPDRFIGLPIPAAGLLLMAVALWCPLPWLAVAAALALSGLMVSTVPIPTLQTIARVLTARGRPHRVPSLRRRPRPLPTANRRRRRFRPPGNRQAVLRHLDRRRRAPQPGRPAQ